MNITEQRNRERYRSAKRARKFAKEFAVNGIAENDSWTDIRMKLAAIANADPDPFWDLTMLWISVRDEMRRRGNFYRRPV